MKLYLFDNDYKYALEQILLTMFPNERPEYPEGEPEGDRMEVRLHRAAMRTTATCKLYRDNVLYRGRAAVENKLMTSELLKDRYCQRLVKNAVYRAALASGVSRPAWGALTGVRPGKLMTPLLKEGLSEEEAARAFTEKYDVTDERARLCARTSRVTLEAEASLEENDICLYVGIPFCPTRCSYCSFVSQSVEKSMALIEPYLTALHRELAATAQAVREVSGRVAAVYMGGGTPTTLSAEQLDALCTCIEREFDLSHVREYTVEAGRPDTVTPEKLAVLRRHGVGRVSVNPQSMSDRVLEEIGRHHTAADIVAALALVRAEGGFEVNMDLIAGLPRDTADGFRETVDRVLALAPENVTVHTLSLKKGSRITRDGAALPSSGEVSAMLDYAAEALGGAGYKPYYLYRQKFMSGGFENVGWEKGNTASLYNIAIMEELCTIIAVGAGGSTKLIRPGDGRNLRIMVPKYPQEYIQSIEKICEDKKKIVRFYTAQEKEKDNGISVE